jgi:hypothetical protein
MDEQNGCSQDGFHEHSHIILSTYREDGKEQGLPLGLFYNQLLYVRL